MPHAPLNSAYFPVPIDAIRSEDLGFDLYLVYERGTAVLYRSCGSGYSVADCEQLREKGITHFYVPNAQHRMFQEAMTVQMCSAYENTEMARAERTRIVRDSCGKIIDDFMQRPIVSGLGETLGTMASKFSDWCNTNPMEFSYLLDMSEHDFYTTTHMLNVGVGCTLLAAELLGSEHELVQQLSLGGLVHDVGKAGVPTEVLNKEGKLSDDEWAMIRRHPQIGADCLREQEGISELAIDMTLNHHERLDGKGYPSGISGDEISLPARICAVVDVYDALTSARPYRGPIPPSKVLEMMREDVGKAFDADVFQAWERVVQRMLEDDPQRAVEDAGQMPELKLEAMIPSAITQCETGNGSVVIRQGNGTTTQAMLVTSTLGEVILEAQIRLMVGEQVKLVPSSGLEEPAQYVSTRFGSKGESHLVFKVLGHGQLVA